MSARVVGLLAAVSVAVVVALAAPGVALASGPPVYLSQFGTSGSGDGQFEYPQGVAVDPGTGDVYVADYNNIRVEKFDSSGKYLSQFSKDITSPPYGVAVNPGTGDVYVVNSNETTGSGSVQMYNASGKYLGGFGDFVDPLGVAVDPGSGDVYVADYDNRVVEFDSSGKYLSQFGSEGSGDGQFSGPQGVAVDPGTGDVYVTDSGNNRVEQFNSSGTYLSQFGSKGSGDGEFDDPEGVAVDPGTGDVYVVDSGNNRVEQFDSSGTYLSQFGRKGSGDGEFNGPNWVAVDPGTGDVYVVDNGNKRVERFGSYVTKSTDNLSLPNDAQEGESVTCPAGMVVLSGGARINSGSVKAGINSSYPGNNRTWDAFANNFSGASTTFNVYAVCATKPEGYVQSNAAVPVSNPAGDQSSTSIACPSGDVPFGGGALANSSSVSVGMASSYPVDENSWKVAMSNFSTSGNMFTAYVVCGQAPPGYAIGSTSASDPAGAQKGIIQDCAAPAVALGGGNQSSNTTNLRIEIKASQPFPASGTGWKSGENNDTSSPTTLTSYAICATH